MTEPINPYLVEIHKLVGRGSGHYNDKSTADCIISAIVDLKLEAAKAERRGELLEKLLNHIEPCACLRPATYARAFCGLCDVCADDPKLDWEYNNKELCLLNQAPLIREVLKDLEND
jgi:hypothetical protein